MSDLPSFGELPNDGEGSKADFAANPDDLDTPKEVVASLRDDGIDPFDLDDRGQVEYADGALADSILPNIEDRSRTYAQAEAEHDLINAFGRTEFDEFTGREWPGERFDPD
jgi:hypothetical protein